MNAKLKEDIEKYKDHVLWKGYFFNFINADGKRTISRLYSFGNPVSLRYAVQFTTKFVRENYISFYGTDANYY